MRRLALALALAMAFSYGGRCSKKSPSTVSVLSDPPSKTGFVRAEIGLGDVHWGETRIVPVAFANAEAHPLRIGSLSTECGCAIVPLAPPGGFRLDPGSVEVWNVEFQAGWSPGHVHALIVAEADSAASFRMELSAEVVGTWSASPHAIDFGPVRRGSERAAKSILFQSSLESVKAVRVQPECPWLAAQLARDGKSIVLTMNPADLRLGPQSAELVICTTSVEKPEGTVFIHAIGINEGDQ